MSPRLLLVVLLMPASGLAQTRQLRTKVSPLRAFMGEVITLEVAVDRDPDDRVSVPRGLKMRPFEVLRRRTHTADAPGGGDRVRQVVRIELLAFEMGELVIPSIELRLVHPSGQVETLRTDPARVTVAGRLDDVETAEPKGNHGPVQVTQERMWPLWAALAVVLAVLQLLVVRAIMKRRMRLKPVAPPAPPPLPPWEIALTKLGGIERSGMADKGLAKEHYDAVSDVIREYLGALDGFDGLEMTTEEILSRLRDRAPAGVSYPQLLGFFAECDLVKFARQAATPEQASALCKAAVDVVDRTRAAVLSASAATGAEARP
jgi:hypothetical protein